MRALIAVVLLVGCGGAPPRPADPAVEARAIASWQRGELEESARIALEHRDTSSEPLREIGARAALALGCPDEALAMLRSARSEPLARVRASAHLAREEWSAAARILASLPRSEDDPYAVLVAEVAQALGDRVPFEGEIERDAIALEDLPMPVIPVSVEGRRTLALIATSVDVTLVAPALRASSGALDELQLGSTRLRNVPFFVRPLADESAALGVELGVVIGTDLLTRARAVIDGPADTLRLGAAEGTAPVMLDGSFAVVRPSQACDAASGSCALPFFVLDTAGAFEAALTPRGERSVRGEPVAIEGGPAPMEAIRIADFRVLDHARDVIALRHVVALRGVLDETLEEITGAPIGGAIGWAVLRHAPLALPPAACPLASAELTARGG